MSKTKKNVNDLLNAMELTARCLHKLTRRFLKVEAEQKVHDKLLVEYGTQLDDMRAELDRLTSRLSAVEMRYPYMTSGTLRIGTDVPAITHDDSVRVMGGPQNHWQHQRAPWPGYPVRATLYTAGGPTREPNWDNWGPHPDIKVSDGERLDMFPPSRDKAYWPERDDDPC